ncbi:phage terminase large subunit family protein, partial [Salmonella enterica subsp. enterica serovar Agona]|nr:phage terminase large subunit family protein [Salmonella enterica subsp. enterica serovar Agona]
MQLTSERRVFRGGNYVWEKRTKSNNDRNEMLDTLNYALISVKWVLSRLGAHPFKELRIYNANQLRKVQSEFDNDIGVSYAHLRAHETDQYRGLRGVGVKKKGGGGGGGGGGG